MNEILAILQTSSPIGVIALLVVVIYSMIRTEQKMNGYKDIATNHISCLPELNESIKRMESTMIRIEQEMHFQTNMLTEIKAKIKK